MESLEDPGEIRSRTGEIRLREFLGLTREFLLLP